MAASPEPRLEFDRGTLLLRGLPSTTRPPGPPGTDWRWDDRIAAWRCLALHHAALRDPAARAGIRTDTVLDASPVAFRPDTLPTLRGEQEAALAAWRAAGHRGQIIMPTGTGKTVVALAAMQRLGVSTLVVAPVRDLMYQWHRRILSDLGYDAGLVGDQHFQVRGVSVATYDSAFIHMERLGNRFELVVFDEEHHLPGGRLREAAQLCAAPYRLGLTATPERADGKHVDLVELVGPEVYRLAMSSAKGHLLADFGVVRIPVWLNDEEESRYRAARREVKRYIFERRKTVPSYGVDALAADSGREPEARRVLKAMHLARSIEDRAAEKLRVLEDVFRLHVGERVIVFAGSNVMAMEVSRRFLVPTILSHTPKRERLVVLSGFEQGRFPVLVANQVLDEGVDVPAAKVAVVIGGLSSTRQAQQRLGRVLRPSNGARATLYEVVCEGTREVERSQTRRRNDAYTRPRHSRV
jgi:superfamily II DNA or RNA helicase